MRSSPSSQSSFPDSSTLLLIAVSMVSFFVGTIFTAHMNMECATGGLRERDGGGALDHHYMDAKVEEMAQRRVRQIQAGQSEESKEKSSPLVKFPETTKSYAGGMARTSKTDFFELVDAGVPMDLPKDGDSDVLLLYSRKTALPNSYNDPTLITDGSSIPQLSTEDALQNCDYVNVILADNSRSRNQCTAIVPNYESYHIQKWMRIDENGLNSEKDLALVPRGYTAKGRESFHSPKEQMRKDNWDILKKYFETFEVATSVLKPLLEKVATPQKTVTVMVSNFGQSELLMNFVCAAKSRNLDISSIIVFATDSQTLELAEGLGLTAFYDEWNYGDIPSEAARAYGDKKFTAMMMAKVMCVQMVSSLGYNVLFQDVDIVWYKNPVPYFEEKHTKLQDFDMMFQDDGGHSTRYAPYSANSGFYYVRANAKTAHFFSALLGAGDLILETKSHQQALIALLSEHVSLFGLKVKVFSRDTDDFPGGYHFHQATGKYMRKFFGGEVHPYIFHMSWTMNKDNKLNFLQQLEEWYVEGECLNKTPAEIDPGGRYVSSCCLAAPHFECHYRDKPSKYPCYDSPPIDKGKKSFWKPGEFDEK